MGAQVLDIKSRRAPTFDDVVAAAVHEAVTRIDDGTCLLMKEVAARLRVSPNTVTRLVREGELRVVTIGQSKRIRLADVRDYLDRHSS